MNIISKNKVGIKYKLLSLALALSPTLVSAQGTYTDNGGYGATQKTMLEFRIDPVLGGAVITGIGAYDLPGNGGSLAVPEVVEDSSIPSLPAGDVDNTALQAISAMTGIEINTLILDGIPVVGIESVDLSNGIYGNTAITGLSLPTSLKMVGTSTFESSGLTGDLDLSTLKQLARIGDYAFFNCTNLTGQLLLPSGGALVSIGRLAFEQTLFSGILTIPSTVTSIGAYAFGGCRFSGDVVVPPSVTSIGEQAFTEMENVKSFTVNGTSLTLGLNVFWNIPHLEYIDMTNATLSTVPTSLSREINNVFGGVQTHTLIYLPHDDTGTLANDLAGLGDLNNANYVLDGVCEAFRVEDGNSYFVPREFKANTAQYVVSNGTYSYSSVTKRAFTKGTVSTVYLPFPFKLSDPSALRGYTLLDKKNTPAEVFRFEQQDPAIGFAANTPYVARDIVGGSQLPDAMGVTVPITPISGINYVYDYDFDAGAGAHRIGDIISSAYTGATAVQNPNTTITINDPDTGAPWKLCGTTETITNELALSQPWNAWILNSNVWYTINGGTYQDITPMRAFLYSTDGTATAKPNIELTDLDGTTTGISGLDGDEPSNSVETRIYNIGGQYVGNDLSSLPKGIYIVNGKKVVK